MDPLFFEENAATTSASLMRTMSFPDPAPPRSAASSGLLGNVLRSFISSEDANGFVPSLDFLPPPPFRPGACRRGRACSVPAMATEERRAVGSDRGRDARAGVPDDMRRVDGRRERPDGGRHGAVCRRRDSKWRHGPRVDFVHLRVSRKSDVFLILLV